jgi:hypothetical protein
VGLSTSIIIAFVFIFFDPNSAASVWRRACSGPVALCCTLACTVDMGGCAALPAAIRRRPHHMVALKVIRLVPTNKRQLARAWMECQVRLGLLQVDPKHIWCVLALAGSIIMPLAPISSLGDGSCQPRTLRQNLGLLHRQGWPVVPPILSLVSAFD